jgi:hypothetical protein
MSDDIKFLPGCPSHMDATYDDLVMALRRISKLEAELQEAEAELRKFRVSMPRFAAHPDIDDAKFERILDVCEKQHTKIQELNKKLEYQAQELKRYAAGLVELRRRLDEEATIRPSLEVLQRMANGIDQFDQYRLQCAVAALQYEMQHPTLQRQPKPQLQREVRPRPDWLKVIDDDGPDAA